MTGIWTGTALVFAAAGGWIVPLGITVAVLAALAAAPRTTQTLLPAVLVIAAALCGAARAAPHPAPAPTAWADSATAIRGTVVSNPTRSGRSQGFVVEVTEIEEGSAWGPADGHVCAIAPPLPIVRLTDLIVLAGTIEPIEDHDARFRPVMRNRGCGVSMFARGTSVESIGQGWRPVMADARDGMSAVLKRLAPGDAGALMSGLVTGDDEALSREAQAAFVATSTTHITAVSGSNFTTLLVLFVATGRASGLRRRLPWILLILAIIWGYALFVGLQPPALRAAIVATGASLALLVGRRPDIVTLTMLAAAIIVAANPATIWSLSFQLSLAASLAIATIATSPTQDRLFAWLGSALLATLVAQLATLPTLLPLSGGFTLMSLPANLAIGPLVTLAFPLSMVAGALGVLWLPLGEAIAVPARLLCEGIVALVTRSSAVGGYINLGTATPRTLFALTLLAALACVAVSREGHRFWQQGPQRWAIMSDAEKWLWGGAFLGAAVTTAEVMLG